MQTWYRNKEDCSKKYYKINRQLGNIWIEERFIEKDLQKEKVNK